VSPNYFIDALLDLHQPKPLYPRTLSTQAPSKREESKRSYLSVQRLQKISAYLFSRVCNIYLKLSKIACHTSLRAYLGHVSPQRARRANLKAYALGRTLLQSCSQVFWVLSDAYPDLKPTESPARPIPVLEIAKAFWRFCRVVTWELGPELTLHTESNSEVPHLTVVYPSQRRHP